MLETNSSKTPPMVLSPAQINSLKELSEIPLDKLLKVCIDHKMWFNLLNIILYVILYMCAWIGNVANVSIPEFE